MRKSAIIYIIIIAVFILLATALEKSTPKKINWTPRYSNTGKQPFDLKIFTDQVKKLDKWKKKTTYQKTFYEFYNDTTLDNNNLLMLIDESVYFDQESTYKLLEFLNKGNDVFISSNNIDYSLLDTLEVNIHINKNFNLHKDSAQIALNFQSKRYLLDKTEGDYIIDNYDTNTVVTHLGSVIRKNEKKGYSNFIKIKVGSGNLFIHAAPVVFTNYYMLNGNINEYVSYLLNYSDKQNLILQVKDSDEMDKGIGDHPLRYIFSQPALKWAWYIALAGLLMFIFFTAKRKQRTIPIIKPLENKTVAYTQTVSDLFYDIRDHHHIGKRREVYFLEYLRSKYFVDTQTLNEKFIQQLKEKSGVSEEILQPLVYSLNIFNGDYTINEQLLIELDKLIQQFKQEEEKLKAIK